MVNLQARNSINAETKTRGQGSCCSRKAPKERRRTTDAERCALVFACKAYLTLTCHHASSANTSGLACRHLGSQCVRYWHIQTSRGRQTDGFRCHNHATRWDVRVGSRSCAAIAAQTHCTMQRYDNAGEEHSYSPSM